jgi:O-antigen ligase
MERISGWDLYILGTGDPKFAGGRVDGPFDTAEEFGMVISVAVLIITNMPAAETRSSFWKWIRRGSIVLGIVGVLFTLTRGIWLALVAGFITQLLLNMKKSMPIIAALLLAVLILLPFASAFLGAGDNIYMKRIGNVQTIYSRLATFKVSLAMFKDRPMVGVGYAGFTAAVMRSPERYVKYYNNEVSVSTPHNAYLGTLAETGVIGLFFLLSMYVTFFRYSQFLRAFSLNPKVIAWANTLLCVIASYLVDGFGHDMTHNTGCLHKFIFIIAGVVSCMVSRCRQEWRGAAARRPAMETPRGDPAGSASALTTGKPCDIL